MQQRKLKQVEKQFEVFGLQLDKEVVATVFDGASLMVKFGKKTASQYLNCWAHAIHLAVCGV